jgi:leader peptidase (prepilin peptidase)/N-methyltransferase
MDRRRARAGELVRTELRCPSTVGAIVVVEAAILIRFGMDARVPALLYLGALGVLLARIDIRARRLPFAVTVPALPVTAALLALQPALGGGQVPLTRAAASAAGWLALFWLIRAMTRGAGMGFGDVILAPTLGLALGWLGWRASLVGLAGGFILAAVAALLMVATGRAGRESSMPFGPFMLAGGWLGAMAGPAIWTAYLAAGR